MQPTLRIARRGLTAVVMVIASGGLAVAQERSMNVFVGWAPFVGEQVEVHDLRGWTASLSGESGPLTPAVDVTGWYFGHGQHIHSFLAGAKYVLPHSQGVAPFVQIVTGPMIWHAYRTAYGLGLAPGGGADVFFPDSRFGIRVAGDYFAMYAPGDYGRHYWGHVWRLSTGVVFQIGK